MRLESTAGEVTKMAAKKKVQQGGPARPSRPAKGPAKQRLRRSDDDKVELVRRVLASGNQSAEIKALGIYPNQFYDWKKRFAAQLGGAASPPATGGRGPARSLGRGAADEAKAFLSGRAALLERLRAQRKEIDQLISQLED
jgi:transposase-like protein